MHIAVVGGSLGGLTAACLLRDAGHRVVVYERSPLELEERGAGIGLLPATYRYLVEFGGLSLDAVAVPTAHIRYLGRDGSVIHDEQHSYLFSSWNTVYRAMLGCFGRASYLMAHELIDIDVGTLALRFSTGEVVHPDLAVCADGVASTARSVLLPDVRPRYAGYVAWRGVVPEADLERDHAPRSTTRSPITCTPTATSSCIRFPVATGLWHLAND